MRENLAKAVHLKGTDNQNMRQLKRLYFQKLNDPMNKCAKEWNIVFSKEEV
jgi:hypothetical protein